MRELFTGKTVLVTGGASGIGLSTALAFAREGANVAIGDIVSSVRAEEASARIKEAGAEALFVECDVSEAGAVEGMIQRTVAKFGRIDCAFNNAGIIGVPARIIDYPDEMADRVLRTNVRGVWLCMKYEIIHMLQHGGGSIVNCASAAALVGVAGLAPYVASKHAVAGFTKSAALEYAREGIRVNAVCPGLIKTPMLEGLQKDIPDIMTQWAAMEPMGRLGNPEEIAEAVLWLSSHLASFVTGHIMLVDGGLIAA
jgi:NAD(P)-dependent dehydrogenase (short-subunit alcohol dehydrogenase family)